MADDQTFGERLKQFRKRAGFTQKDLSELINISFIINIDAEAREYFNAIQYAGMATTEMLAAKEARIEDCKKNLEILEELEIDLRDIFNRHIF